MNGDDLQKSVDKPSAVLLQEGNTSKHSVRSSVWAYLEKNRLVNFPRPAYGRIPNFKGAEQACAKLLKLEEFQSAKSIEVNPDKPLEIARVICLEQNKILFVPVPRLHDGLLKKLTNNNLDGRKQKSLRYMVNRKGLEDFGKAIDFDEQISIDLLVLGSVAVSLNGHRIGKGKGYADLEYAILKEMKAVDNNTIIVTIVHDSQVFDVLPDDIFNKHDVPLNYILTPTRIIKIDTKHTRPVGLYWDLLSEKRVEMMPVLKKMYEFQKSQGKEIILKSADPDINLKMRLRPGISNYEKRRAKNYNNQNMNQENQNRELTKRWYYKRGPKNCVDNVDKENRNNSNEENMSIKLKRSYRRPPRRIQFDYSLLVSNIQRSVRLRHLKDALITNGIKPNNIIWRGHKGFCYLHYVKPGAKKKDKTVEHEPFAVDNIIEILQNLKLTPESHSNLTVKVMEPITRIETTDVTSV